MNPVCQVCQTEDLFSSEHCLVCGSELEAHFSSKALENTLETRRRFNQHELENEKKNDMFYSYSSLPAPDEEKQDESLGFTDESFLLIQDFKTEQQKLRENTTFRDIPPRPNHTNQEVQQLSSSTVNQVIDFETIPRGTHILTVYHQKKPALIFPILKEKILLGRVDPATNNWPDLDLTPFDPDFSISRKHLYLSKEDEQFFVLPISSAGTQINRKLISIGNKSKLSEGDILVLSGKLAMHFSKL